MNAVGLAQTMKTVDPSTRDLGLMLSLHYERYIMLSAYFTSHCLPETASTPEELQITCDLLPADLRFPVQSTNPLPR